MYGSAVDELDESFISIDNDTRNGSLISVYARASDKVIK